MYKPHSRLQQLRSSQRFLSREQPGGRRLGLCCCDDAEIAGEDVLLPAVSLSPQPKISIKKLRRQSPNGCNHTNSDFSFSKQSQRSNLPASKKTTQTHIACPHCRSDHVHKPLLQSYPTNITFLYSDAPHEQSNHYNVKTCAPDLKPKALPTPAPPRHSANPKQLDESIEKQFKNILDFGDNAREEYTYGEAFPLEMGEVPRVKAGSQNMPNFSFGQNQKEQFMSKYLNVRQEGVVERVVISSKENSKRSEMMREIVEERMSKSSKSSGRVFVRGTFNKQNLTNLGQRRDFMYKSESEISLQSSQSLVLESYQSIMRKKESFIREYQY